MEVIRETTEFKMKDPTAITLGKFDGLHLGHQLLLERVLQKKEEGLKAFVFTFDFSSRPGLALPWERRNMLEQKGIDILWECPFVPEISHMDPEEFVKKILVEDLKVRYLAVGTDFRFGYQRKGDYCLLQKMGKTYGFEVEVVEKACHQGREISSTYIREELEKGNIPLVNRLLGYPYFVSGEVLHGRKLGRTMGLPTVNQQPEQEKLLPPNGVYATRTRIGENTFSGITNVGYKPTVGGESRKGVETFLFDVNEDLYGKKIRVEFYGFERPEQRFSSLEELKGQIEQDVKWGRDFLSQKEKEEEE